MRSDAIQCFDLGVPASRVPGYLTLNGTTGP